MIRVYADLEALSRAAAELFVLEAHRAVASRDRFVVLLAGGATPRRTYELLAAPPFGDRVPWPAVHIFWGDERCVPPDDRRSNASMTRRALLDHVPVPLEQIHPITCSGSPGGGAAEYEELLRDVFPSGVPGFDLVFLGLGENGHTASLFPGTPALDERERWVTEVYVAEEELHRVTLTVPIINQAALVIFLVAGAGKAQVLREVLEGEPAQRLLPAQLIRPVKGGLLWLVDREAASLLHKRIGMG
ncbi:MAG TPA: 6-phosphogluconolactonase [Geobacteraceae bacterium]|nr:6-phosphogluconolactonase [Geobacteraceae bacterium]